MIKEKDFFRENRALIWKVILMILIGPIIFLGIIYISIWITLSLKMREMTSPTFDYSMMILFVKLSILGAIAMAVHIVWLDIQQRNKDKKNSFAGPAFTVF
jgi:hypothetical protein